MAKDDKNLGTTLYMYSYFFKRSHLYFFSYFDEDNTERNYIVASFN